MYPSPPGTRVSFKRTSTSNIKLTIPTFHLHPSRDTPKLSPEEIHKLASKTRKGVDAEEGKASCHSDYVDPDEAKAIQKDQLVQLNTAPAHNLPSHDPLI